MTLITTPWKNFISSPLGLVPKPDGGWRRIHHLSFPKGLSVNCHIPEEWGSLEYTTFDKAIEAVLRCGPGAVMIKKDLADAFRHIPVAEADWWLLGFHWNGSYWIDRFLPFGLRTSPMIFDLFAKGLHWILLYLGWRELLHYLDDFWSIYPNWSAATAHASEFDLICSDLGFSVQAKKDKIGTIVDFLGIELDTIAMEARLSPEKLQRAITLVDQTLRKTHITLEGLQSLVGFLSFACKVIPLGRTFIRRLLNALSNVKGKVLHLTSDMRLDLKWWKDFLPKWNGIRLLTNNKPIIRLWTDASGRYGIGGYYLKDKEQEQDLTGSMAFSRRFSTRLRHRHINVKETQAILHALRIWTPQLKGSHLIIHCDNEAVATGLRKLTLRGSAMKPLRELLMLAALNDISIESVWIPTRSNILADLFSRGKFKLIADKFPFLQTIAATMASASRPRTGIMKSL